MRFGSVEWLPNLELVLGSECGFLYDLCFIFRVEHRLADGATNPYLSLASILAAGLDGIENKLGTSTYKANGFVQIPVNQ